MLHDSLEDERQADALLTTLAKGEVNQDALITARRVRARRRIGVRPNAFIS